MTSFVQARWVALLLPASLLAGALGSQYWGGLFPCEMCHWQRWPHYAAVVLALLAFAPIPAQGRRMFVILAALAILISGGIGVLHAGVEYRWWEGPTQCSAALSSGGNTLTQILATPMIRCDQPQWTLGGISLAGFNALFSLVGGMLILWLIRKPQRPA